MELCAIITHRLALALRLVDTASGHNISGRIVELSVNNKPLHYAEKPDGMLVFQDLGMKQFLLCIRSRHYESTSVEIDLDLLDPNLPLIECQLIPNERYRGLHPILTLEGELPGISSLMAVRAGESPCLIREVEPKKKLIKIFNPHHLELKRTHYALVDPDQGCFEPFCVLHRKDLQTLQVEQLPEMEFRNYFPLCPIIFGITRSDGRYCLRVQDDAQAARWLIRYTVDGQPRFQTIDFRQEGQVILT